MDQQEIDGIVTQVRQALSARQKPSSAGDDTDGEHSPAPRLVTEAMVVETAKSGRSVIEIAPGAVVTPLARDALRAHSISLASRLPTASVTGMAPAERSRVPVCQGSAKVRVAVGVVPTARTLEPVVMASVRDAGLIGICVPSPVREAAHLARQVAGAVSGGEATWGIIVEETGLVGPAISNRVQGVIAAACHDVLSARWARERLGANVLCLSAEVVAPALLREIVATWIATPAVVCPDIASVVRELDRG